VVAVNVTTPNGGSSDTLPIKVARIFSSNLDAYQCCIAA
jgi:hypothetical protein